MDLVVKKVENLNGEVTAPGSKSQTIRAIIVATLAEGRSVIRCPLFCDDTKAAIDVCRKLGAKITGGEDFLVVESEGVPLQCEGKLFTGDSGITTRFILPVLGLLEEGSEVVVDCGEQMKKRPVESLIEALERLGMKFEYLDKNNGFPLKISGKLCSGKVVVEGETSQYLSALLLSAPYVRGGIEISVFDLNERPYSEMTLDWLDQQGIKYRHDRKGDLDTYLVEGSQIYKTFDYKIPGDFSSASYLIAAAVLLSGEVVINNLSMSDKQGDKRLVEILLEMGADIFVKENSLEIRGGKALKGGKIDANDIPDLVPTLAVVGTVCEGGMEIFNVRHARIKETDRIFSMSDNLKKMGATILEKEDGLVIERSNLKGNLLKGFDDHRTVMALSIAGLIAEGKTKIDSAKSIKKTFPAFVDLMNSLGCNMKTI